MLAACKRAKKETEAETGEISEENSEVEENKTFIYITLSFNKSLSEDSLEEDSSSDEEDNWEDDPSNLPTRKSSWLDIGKTSYTKEKLVKIFIGEVLIPKQR